MHKILPLQAVCSCQTGEREPYSHPRCPTNNWQSAVDAIGEKQDTCLHSPTAQRSRQGCLGKCYSIGADVQDPAKTEDGVGEMRNHSSFPRSLAPNDKEHCCALEEGQEHGESSLLWCRYTGPAAGGWGKNTGEHPLPAPQASHQPQGMQLNATGCPFAKRMNLNSYHERKLAQNGSYT